MKKAQAAMEYLMTYGWAILIVVVVVAALFALGVFSPAGSRIPCSPCFGSGDFTFIDYAAGTFIMRTGPREIILDSLVTTPAGGTSTDVGNQLNPGSDVTITGVPITGDIDLSLGYIVVSSGLIHNDTATIHN